MIPGKTSRGYRLVIYFKDGELLKPLSSCIKHFFKDIQNKIQNDKGQSFNNIHDPQIIEEQFKKDIENKRLKDLFGD